jgi:ATP-binding cassette subfamily B protein
MLFSFFWQFLKDKKRFLIALLLTSIGWAALHAIGPYVLKTIIDEAVQAPKERVFSAVAYPLAIFIFIQVAIDISFRFKEILMIWLIPETKAKMRQKMFDYVQQHSYRYFQENLSGSLSNKVLDMVRAFEHLFMCVDHTFVPVGIMYLFTIVLLWSVHPAFGLFVIFWVVVYLVVAALFAKKCIDYADDHSEANSLISGKIVDVFKNSSAVRIFARRLFENKYLKGFQEKEVALNKRLGWFLFKIHVFKG